MGLHNAAGTWTNPLYDHGPGDDASSHAEVCASMADGTMSRYKLVSLRKLIHRCSRLKGSKVRLHFTALEPAYTPEVPESFLAGVVVS